MATVMQKMRSKPTNAVLVQGQIVALDGTKNGNAEQGDSTDLRSSLTLFH